MTPETFTKLQNRYLEALARIRIPGEARQVLDVIIRKTIGYHTDRALIKLSEIVIATYLKKPNILRAEKKLINMRLISVIKKDNEIIKTYVIVTNCDRWKSLSKKITTAKKRPIVDNPVDNMCITPKEPLSKKITNVIQKDNAFHCTERKKEIRTIVRTKIRRRSKTPKIPVIFLEKTFNIFWSLYPRKAGDKDKILEKWIKLAPNDILAGRIFASVLNHMTIEWNIDLTARNQYEFVPHPSTFLNQRRYNSIHNLSIGDMEGSTGENLWAIKRHCWTSCKKLIPGKLSKCLPSHCQEMFCSKADIDQAINDERGRNETDIKTP